MSSDGLAFHADWVVKDVRCCNCTKELEVGEVETVTKLKVSWLRPLCTGPGRIKDCLLLWVAHGAEESKTRIAVLCRVTTRDGLESVLDEHRRLTVNPRGF